MRGEGRAPQPDWIGSVTCALSSRPRAPGDQTARVPVLSYLSPWQQGTASGIPEVRTRAQPQAHTGPPPVYSRFGQFFKRRRRGESWPVRAAGGDHEELTTLTRAGGTRRGLGLAWVWGALQRAARFCVKDESAEPAPHTARAPLLRGPEGKGAPLHLSPSGPPAQRRPERAARGGVLPSGPAATLTDVSVSFSLAGLWCLSHCVPSATSLLPARPHSRTAPPVTCHQPDSWRVRGCT